MTNPQYFVAVPTAEQMPPDNNINNMFTWIIAEGGIKATGAVIDGKIMMAQPAPITHWLRPAPEVEAMQAQMERMRNALEDVKTSIRAAAHTEMDSAGRYPTGAEVATRLAHSKLYQTITSALEAGKIEK